MAEQTRATATEGDTTLSLSPDTGFVAADESAIDDAAGGFSVEGYAREFPAAGCPADAKCPWLRNAHPKVVGCFPALWLTTATFVDDVVAPGEALTDEADDGVVDSFFATSLFRNGTVEARLRPAIVRLSNGRGPAFSNTDPFTGTMAGLTGDWMPDVRGLAVKVLGVAGDRSSGDWALSGPPGEPGVCPATSSLTPLPHGTTGCTGRPDTQDFVAITAARNYVRDAAHAVGHFRAVYEARVGRSAPSTVSAADRATVDAAFADAIQAAEEEGSWLDEFAAVLRRVLALTGLDMHALLASLADGEAAVVRWLLDGHREDLVNFGRFGASGVFPALATKSFFTEQPLAHGRVGPARYRFSPCAESPSALLENLRAYDDFGRVGGEGEGGDGERRLNENVKRDAFLATIGERAVCWDVSVQPEVVEKQPAWTPESTAAAAAAADDATFVRSTPYLPLAKLIVPRVDATNDEAAADQCRHLAFNPGNGVVDHAPVGDTNVLRARVYRNAAQLRRLYQGEVNDEAGADVFCALARQALADTPATASLLCSLGHSVVGGSDADASTANRLLTDHVCPWIPPSTSLALTWTLTSTRDTCADFAARDEHGNLLRGGGEEEGGGGSDVGLLVGLSVGLAACCCLTLTLTLAAGLALIRRKNRGSSVAPPATARRRRHTGEAPSRSGSSREGLHRAAPSRSHLR